MANKGICEMNASGRTGIVLLMVSAAAMFALSARAEDAPQKPEGKAAVQTPRAAPGRPPGPAAGDTRADRTRHEAAIMISLSCGAAFFHIIVSGFCWR